ncbi:Alpha/Beta hydrolase protein [Peziza echinospora]|nr:Alpha/Beta hydrolase protein [Peziza echinospora]
MFAPRSLARCIHLQQPKINLAAGCHVRPIFRHSYSTNAVIPLSYTLHEPPNATDKAQPPIIVMHGLFGSKQNNRSISKMFAKDLNRPVYAVDLRNHGDSPHATKHDYPAMAADVEHFIEEKGLKDVTLLGHSMGAKTAMAVSLRRPELVANIIAVDNAPIEAALSSSFGQYVQAMRRIEGSNVLKHSDADAILKEYEPNVVIRQFLLTNLTRPVKEQPTGDNSPVPMKFRVPIRTLAKSLDEMAGFPYHPDKIRFEKPALFIRGTKSKYVPDEAIPLIGRFFPYFRLKDIDAGHWGE